jgi:N-methylhydantoinase B/oxoprolinase/acetone carboxylase alpha subunit
MAMVTVTSAHRTAQEQSCMCEGEKGPCAGRPRIVKGKKGRRYMKRSTSHHQDGIALDVRAGTGSGEGQHAKRTRIYSSFMLP